MNTLPLTMKRSRFAIFPAIIVAILSLTAFAECSLAQNKNFKIEGTYQIQEGQRKGWLILNVSIPQGYHIYALTQKGSPPPTKIQLAESKQFKLIQGFKSNKKPKVIEHDPTFDQRLEEYEGKVVLMAPVEIAEGVDLKNVKFDLKISGQLCNDKGCQLFNNKKIDIEFGGFYKEDGKDK